MKFLYSTLITFLVTVCAIAMTKLAYDLLGYDLPFNLWGMAIFMSVNIALAITIYIYINKKYIDPPNAHSSDIVQFDDLFSYTHDSITCLPTAQQALKKFTHAMTSVTGQRYAAIVFKPINFQQVNKLLGSRNSDLLLLQLAYCLQQQVMNNINLLSFDITPNPVRVARLQGLQFLVVYNLTTNNFDDESVLNDLCQQLNTATPQGISFQNFALNFELSFGLAISGTHGNSASEVVANARDAMLAGVKTQKNINYFNTDSILYNQDQLNRMESLCQDINNEKLSFYLQPQVNINNYHIIGFQLRVHWHEIGVNKPQELFDFSELAEKSGSVHKLTKNMLKQAFISLEKLHSIGVYQRLSVTFASESSFETDLVDFIEQQLSFHDIAGKYLMIEFNEHIMLNASERVKSIIDQLKSLDVNISIDNFSGSYESLRYIRKMAVHELKVRCQELTNDGENRVDKAMTNALVTLTRSMKVPLIGTEINRHEASQAFTAMGGELIQGEIIHAGLMPNNIESWLEQWYLQHPKSVPLEARPSIY
jgi:EAL domain-containing protein (putative c-di-GMP-specific phosphodiesterase class I)/GGDEF domain-containing protein